MHLVMAYLIVESRHALLRAAKKYDVLKVGVSIACQSLSVETGTYALSPFPVPAVAGGAMGCIEMGSSFNWG